MIPARTERLPLRLVNIRQTTGRGGGGEKTSLNKGGKSESGG